MTSSTWHKNFMKMHMVLHQPRISVLKFLITKRISFLLLHLTLAGFIYAQGPQQLVTVPIATGATTKGWLYLPSDYTTSTKSYPVVLFYHGAGEAGTNPYLMFKNGIPKLIADGMRPDKIVNPVDGQPYSFIVLSLQHWSWSPDPEWLPLEIEWLKKSYRIDTNRIYVTGLSAGGQESFKAVVTNARLSSLIAAAAPMSPPPMGNFTISLIRTYRIKTWFFSGNVDPITPTVQKYSAACDSVYPGSSKFYVYPGAHCCWNSYYNINWRDPVSGLSLWQWFLSHKKEPPFIVTFKDFKVTDLGNKMIKVVFSIDNPNGSENFYIRVKIKGNTRKIEVSPSDKTGTNTYSKIINLN